MKSHASKATKKQRNPAVKTIVEQLRKSFIELTDEQLTDISHGLARAAFDVTGSFRLISYQGEEIPTGWFYYDCDEFYDPWFDAVVLWPHAPGNFSVDISLLSPKELIAAMPGVETLHMLRCEFTLQDLHENMEQRVEEALKKMAPKVGTVRASMLARFQRAREEMSWPEQIGSST